MIKWPDIVLDAFCGCGTALGAAQNLGREWIDIQSRCQIRMCAVPLESRSLTLGAR